MTKFVSDSDSQLSIELAEISGSEQDDLREGEGVVLALYSALASGDGDGVQRLVAEDLDWWFHGPRISEQHLMRMLTGLDRLASFAFVPLRLCTIGDKVFVEGRDKPSNVCWVHVWSLLEGRVTQLREYINTSVTVTGLDASTLAPNSPEASKVTDSDEIFTLWQSELSGRSIPGLILSIE